MDSGILKNDSLVGEWMWIKSFGGIGGVIQTPQNTKMVKEIIFKDNGDFMMIENCNSVLKSTYFTEHKKSLLLNDTCDFITVKDLPWPLRYLVKKDSLFISEDVYDGFNHLYLRINNNK